MGEPAEQTREREPSGQGAALAKFRTQLALDRTTLAWIRTALSMVGFGFGTVAFFRSLREHHPEESTRRLHQMAIAFGLALLVLGLVALALAGASHWRSLQSLQRGTPLDAGRWPLSLALALLLAVLGLVGLTLLLSF